MGKLSSARSMIEGGLRGAYHHGARCSLIFLAANNLVGRRMSGGVSASAVAASIQLSPQAATMFRHQC